MLPFLQKTEKPLLSSYKFFGTFHVADGSTSLHRTIS